VCFHGFADFSLDDDVHSPEFTCFGHAWGLQTLINGIDSSVQVVLLNMSDDDESIDIEYYFSVRNLARKEVAHCDPQTETFTCCSSSGSGWCWGEADFSQRSTLIDALVEGTLTIEVWMRETLPSNVSPTPFFIPENPLSKNILKKFMDAESADVTFEVTSEDVQGRRSHKRAKASPTVFHAHCLILQDNASTLAELCRPRREEVTIIQITDIRPSVFRLLLYYSYGGKLSKEELKANARDLIDAADKYGIASLKLEAEASYVQLTVLTIDNVLEHLLYAHSKNCALLKEAVMDFILEHREGILGRVSFADVPGDVVSDLLAAVARGAPEEGASGDIHYSSMRVGALRKMLNEKGLEVDGSRETMIALLKEHS